MPPRPRLDAGDPQPPKVALLGAAVARRVLQRALDAGLGDADTVLGAAAEAFGQAQDFGALHVGERREVEEETGARLNAPAHKTEAAAGVCTSVTFVFAFRSTRNGPRPGGPGDRCSLSSTPHRHKHARGARTPRKQRREMDADEFVDFSRVTPWEQLRVCGCLRVVDMVLVKKTK